MAHCLPWNWMYVRTAAGNMLIDRPSPFMRGPRSVHAPDEQKLPVLSVENDWAMSGALPPRIDATILSSLMPPTVLTFTPGCARSKPATTPLMIFNSRAVKPTHSVTVAGASGFSADPAPADVDAGDEDAEDAPPLPPPPPQAAATSAPATSSAVSAPARVPSRDRIAFETSDIRLPSPPRSRILVRNLYEKDRIRGTTHESTLVCHESVPDLVRL